MFVCSSLGGRARVVTFGLTTHLKNTTPTHDNSFQPVLVGEPSVGATVSILRGLKERYESHHGIRITDAAIVLAAKVRPCPLDALDRSDLPHIQPHL